jgi:hypothetical protein
MIPTLNACYAMISPLKDWRTLVPRAEVAGCLTCICYSIGVSRLLSVHIPIAQSCQLIDWAALRQYADRQIVSMFNTKTIYGKTYDARLLFPHLR